MPTTSVSGRTFSSSSRDEATFSASICIALCDVMWLVAVAVVDVRLEDLDLALGDLRAAQPADQLFALAAEHAAGDHFDPAGPGAVCNVHRFSSA